MLESTLKIQLLDIVSLNSDEARSLFSKKVIDDLANSFLKTGGNLKPILVKRIDFESFQVIEGHLEYYASVRAREIDDDFEMVSGIILTDTNNDLILEQYKQAYSSQLPNTNNSSKIDRQPLLNSSGVIRDLEKNLLEHLRDTLTNEISQLESNLSKNLEQKFDGVKILVPCDEDHLEVFNSADLKTLSEKLKSAGFTGKRGEKIAAAVLQERKKSVFSSFEEIVDRVRLQDKRRTRAISAESMLRILDSWNKFIQI